MATTFDRVTPQARWGFQVASILAEYAGQTEIGLDYLLVGAVFSGDNAATQVLRRLGFAPLRVHQGIVDRIFQPARSTARKRSDPSHRLGLAAATRAALAAAVTEAKRLGHTDIGTGHVLLGVARVAEGDTAALLARFKAQADAVRAQVQVIGNPAVEFRELKVLPNPWAARRRRPDDPFVAIGLV